MSLNPFKGRRYVNLLRASTDMQDTSPNDQKAINDRHAQNHLGMIWMGDVVLQGVSGSKTFNRRDLKELLERRRILKNYDVIVVYDSSRLTRGGASHAFSIRRDFAREGVFIVSVMDPIPEGDFKDVIQTVIDTHNMLQAKRGSGFITRGINDAVRNGTVERHGASPYGIDRQYLDATGKPMMRLRYLPGGRRRLIDEATNQVIKELLRGKQPVAAYLMNRGEKTRLVPGDPTVLGVINDAFRLRYRDGWGYTRIARYFVEKGVYPLRAKAWSDGAIYDLLMNPTYLGWSYFRQLKCGLFHSAGEDRPQERNINQDELNRSARV